MELGQLKSCQNQVILIALAGAGVMLGLIKDQKDAVPNYFPVLSLLPLLILLPFWIIFFDKARTIARIVGFLRIQEKLGLYNSDLGVIGWESAMKEYKNRQNFLDSTYIDKRKNEITQKKVPEKIEKSKLLHNSVYWYTVYCVFFLFSFVCILLSIGALKTNPIGYVFSLIILIFLGIVSIGYMLLAYYENGTRDFTLIKRFCTRSGLIIIIFTIIISMTGASMEKLSISWDLFFYCIIIIFWVGFIICASMTLWFFKNLVRGRYTYGEFEWRWKKIFEIEIDDNNGNVTDLSNQVCSN